MTPDKLSTVHMYLKNSGLDKDQEKIYTIRLLGLLDDEICNKLIHDPTGMLKRRIATYETKDLKQIAKNPDLSNLRIIGVIYENRVLKNRLFISERLGIVNQVQEFIDDGGVTCFELCTNGESGSYISITNTYF